MAVSLLAPAKLNLNLKLSGKRADGYHQLVSLVGFSEFGDRLHFAPASNDSLEIEGNLTEEFQQADNLISCARDALRENGFKVPPTHIRLEKHIPIGGGLGGGSADAAATLNGLIQLYDLQIPKSRLHEIAQKLGADVPVCLHPNWYIMSGIGEELAPLSLQTDPPFIVLANPGKHLSTAQVFSTLGAPSRPTSDLATRDALIIDNVKKYWHRKDWRELISIGNDLTEAAIASTPEISAVLSDIEALSDATHYLGTAMSGSGASCFALFDTQASAQTLATQLTNRGYWARESRMRNSL